MNDNIIEVKHLSKQYPGVRALDDINIDIKKGICHCICGENGAGKSTLIKILSGAEKQTEGKIIYKNKEFEPNSIKEAVNSGIRCLYQELNVVEQLTVEQNLTLGLEDTKFGIIKKGNTNAKIYEILQRIDSTINPKSYISDLSIAKRQIVEIVRALATASDVIIMDEPTAALSSEEAKKLFEIIDELRKQHVSILYITHRLDEIFEVGDYVSVLRDGKLIGTKLVSEVEKRTELIRMMLGKVIAEGYVPSVIDYNEKVLEVENLNNKKLKDINFELYKGELLGFYGLIGAGKTEIARALFGVDEKKGKIKISSKEVTIKTAMKAIKNSLALVPEERRSQGLCTPLMLSENIPMMNYKNIARGGITNGKRQLRISQSYIDKINISCRDENHVVTYLSGGNQQKVVVSKCLNAGCSILLLDEPTRGVDVGAKQEIYSIIRELSRQGKSVIIFSSDLPEIINLCDRIVLLYEGQIKEVIKNDFNLDTENIMHIVTGGE